LVRRDLKEQLVRLVLLEHPVETQSDHQVLLDPKVHPVLLVLLDLQDLRVQEAAAAAQMSTSSQSTLLNFVAAHSYYMT
jgi:hypothetical protein